MNNDISLHEHLYTVDRSDYSVSYGYRAKNQSGLSTENLEVSRLRNELQPASNEMRVSDNIRAGWLVESNKRWLEDYMSDLPLYLRKQAV